MKKNNLYALQWVNTFIFVLLFSIFFDEFLFLNNISEHFFKAIQYYFAYTIYVISFFWILRGLLTYPVTVIFKNYFPRLVLSWGILIEVFLFLFTIGEIKLYINQGLHVYDKIVLQSMMSPNIHKEVGIGLGSVAVLIFFIIIFLGIQYITYRRNLKLKKNIQLFSFGLLLALFSWTIFAFIPGHGKVANIFPFYTPLKGLPTLSPLNLSYHFAVKYELKKTPNILFILVESLRGDFLNPQRMPKLSEYFSEHNCNNVKRSFSGGHTTEYGVFTSLYGVYGFHFDDFKKNNIPSFGLTTLSKNNYELIGGSASALKGWNGSGFMFEKFDDYREFKSETIYRDDQNLAKWLLERVTMGKRPKFVFSFFNSTHHNYYFPPDFALHLPIANETYNHLIKGDTTEVFRTKIFNRYKNAALYIDHILFNYIQKAQALLGADTIIVFSGDHGEEFWEEGLLGHGKTSYINPRVHVPIVICPGRQEQLQKHPQHKELANFASHVDIFPTLFDLLGGEKSHAFNGESLLRERKIPYLVVVGPQFPYHRNKMGIIHKDYKFWLKRSGHKLHELHKVRSSDLDDRPISGGADQDTLKEILHDFSINAYRFLKPGGTALNGHN